MTQINSIKFPFLSRFSEENFQYSYVTQYAEPEVGVMTDYVELRELRTPDGECVLDCLSDEEIIKIEKYIHEENKYRDEQ